MADLIISQNLTIPPTLATGAVAQAGDVIPLYQALNAFAIPSVLGAFQNGLVDNNLYTVATGASQDWTVTALATKAILFVLPFSWASATAAPTYILRVNGSAMTGALAFTNASTGSGLLWGWIGGHDADAPRPLALMGLDTGTATTLRVTTATADLPTADTTTIGITVGGTGNTTKLKFVRFWTQG